MAGTEPFRLDVEGLKEFLKALKQLDPELSKEARAKLKVAAESVADKARGKAPSKSGQARKSIRAGADQKGPYVAGGKKSVPYYGWLDFGSRNPISGQPRTVGPWAKSGKGPTGGRFIYPALEQSEDEILDALEKAIAETIAALNL